MLVAGRLLRSEGRISARPRTGRLGARTIGFPSAVTTGRSYTIVEAWDRKSDPTISTTFRFNFSYCVSVETQACQTVQDHFSKFHVDLLYFVSYRSFAVDNSLFVNVPPSNRTLYEFSIPRTIPSLTSLVVTFFPSSSRTVVTLF